jgi:competence protein ComEA
MKQIIPALPDSEKPPVPNRVFGDAPEPEPGRAPFKPLFFIVVLAVIYGIFSLGGWSQRHAPHPPPTGPYETSAKLPASAQSKIVVHVVGAVRRPGVYTLSMDARIQDALKKAGGALPSGDPNTLNLAAWAEDGSRIEVPFKTKVAGSESSLEADDKPLITVARSPEDTTSEKPTAKPIQDKTKPAKPDAAKTQTKAVPSRKINLNKASLDDLTLLPGVGPATAEKIIEHRKTNGAFSSVDDLVDIKGIGEKKLEKIRPYATVR